MDGFNGEGGNELGFDFFVDALGDRLLQDAHDYFKVYLLRDYPDLDFEPMNGEALGWLITLPQQREYSLTIVEAACILVQDDLFWKKDTLIRFAIVRDGEELGEDE
jgi:hypothetical protein